MIIVAGAISGVVWQPRQAGFVILMGRAMESERPVGVSRSPLSWVTVGWFLNSWTRSASQSAARSR